MIDRPAELVAGGGDQAPEAAADVAAVVDDGPDGGAEAGQRRAGPGGGAGVEQRIDARSLGQGVGHLTGRAGLEQRRLHPGTPALLGVVHGPAEPLESFLDGTAMVEQGGQEGPQRRLVGRPVADRVEQAAVEVLVVGEEDGFLGGEVAEERAGGDVGPGGDLVDGGIGEALLLEQGPGGADDGGPGLSASAPPPSP